MLLGCLGVMIASLGEGLIYKNINEAKNRNFITTLNFVSILIFFTAVSLIPTILATDNFEFSKEFSFLFNKWFYFVLILELAGQWLYREAYYIYKDRFTIVNMFMFSTVFLMPVYAFMLNKVINLDHSVTAIKSLNEALITSSLLFISMIIYFYDKFKFKEIKDVKILLVLSFTMLNCLYFTTKLIQSYNGVFVYIFIMVVLMCYFFALTLKAKEELKVTKNKKATYGLLLVRPFLALAYIKGVAYIPVEIAPIVRRLSQLSAGVIIDKKVLQPKEILGISIIVAVFVYNALKSFNII